MAKTEKQRGSSTSQELKRILGPTDFSKTSLAGLRRAKTLAKKYGASILLIHVIEKAPFISDMGNVAIALSDKEMAKHPAGQHRGAGCPARYVRRACGAE